MELKIKSDYYSKIDDNNILIIRDDGCAAEDHLTIEVTMDGDTNYVHLDRNQAHLLMLYLQEHLKWLTTNLPKIKPLAIL